ncbi:MAG TPA: type II secretion system minor pseudopilin GspJ [Steroidobacteraceae bacterium]
MSKRRQAGFTLIELLVALFITAIMFTIGYGALNQAFRSRKEVDEQSARLIAVQQALRTIEQDFELLQPRPVRQLNGDGYLPAMMTSQNAGSMLGSTASSLGDSSSTSAFPSLTLGNVTSLNGAALPLLSFTRGGWTNPAGLPRSELQRVSYSIENGALMRSYTAELDATLGDVPIKRTLIDHVKSFSMRFMDAGHQWQTQWPVPTLGVGQEGLMLRIRPVAVEVTIELEDWGILMRHIEVAG